MQELHVNENTCKCLCGHTQRGLTQSADFPNLKNALFAPNKLVKASLFDFLLGVGFKAEYWMEQDMLMLYPKKHTTIKWKSHENVLKIPFNCF